MDAGESSGVPSVSADQWHSDSCAILGAFFQCASGREAVFARLREVQGYDTAEEDAIFRAICTQSMRSERSRALSGLVPQF